MPPSCRWGRAQASSVLIDERAGKYTHYTQPQDRLTNKQLASKAIATCSEVRLQVQEAQKQATCLAELLLELRGRPLSRVVPSLHQLRTYKMHLNAQHGV